MIRPGERKADHCCPELVESCCRYEKTLPTLSVNHSTCGITRSAIEPLRNWPAFQLKPKSEGFNRGGVIRWGGRKADHCCPELIESCCRYDNTLSTLPVHHSTCGITCAAMEPLRNWSAFQLKPKSEGSDSGRVIH